MTSELIDDCIYRIQDADGRGPYKPGMSEKWTDKENWHYKKFMTNLPPFMDEFGPSIIDEINELFEVEGGAFGCGFRTMEQLHKWFSKSEQQRLKTLGYHIVKIVPKKIIRSSDKQTVFWHQKPLNEVAELIA